MSNHFRVSLIVFAFSLLLIYGASISPYRFSYGAHDSSSTTYIGINTGNLTMEELMAMRSNATQCYGLCAITSANNRSSGTAFFCDSNTTAIYDYQTLQENVTSLDVYPEECDSESDDANSFLLIPFLAPIILIVFLLIYENKIKSPCFQ